ncbi:MAG: hypothetical protein D8M28_09450 [Proteobacteria bacterium]|nr:hypothetical protein [Pseudomonadota bacterium]
MKFSLWCVIFFTMILSFICLGTKVANATLCDEKYDTLEDRFYGAYDVIFVGTVTATQSDTMTFRIDQALKGLSRQEIKKGYLTFKIQKKDSLSIGERRLLLLDRLGAEYINYYSTHTCQYARKQRLPEDIYNILQNVPRPVSTELLEEMLGYRVSSYSHLYFLGEVMGFSERQNKGGHRQLTAQIKILDLLRNDTATSWKLEHVTEMAIHEGCLNIMRVGQKSYFTASTSFASKENPRALLLKCEFAASYDFDVLDQIKSYVSRQKITSKDEHHIQRKSTRKAGILWLVLVGIIGAVCGAYWWHRKSLK